MMDTPRIQLAQYPGEKTPDNTWPDFDWVQQHERELHDQYGTCVALIYQQQVVGIGQTIQEAAENAEANLDSDMGVITPVIAHLYPPRFTVHPNIPTEETST